MRKRMGSKFWRYIGVFRSNCFAWVENSPTAVNYLLQICDVKIQIAFAISGSINQAWDTRSWILSDWGKILVNDFQGVRVQQNPEISEKPLAGFLTLSWLNLSRSDTAPSCLDRVAMALRWSDLASLDSSLCLPLTDMTVTLGSCKKSTQINSHIWSF